MLLPVTGMIPWPGGMILPAGRMIPGAGRMILPAPAMTLPASAMIREAGIVLREEGRPHCGASLSASRGRAAVLEFPAQVLWVAEALRRMTGGRIRQDDRRGTGSMAIVPIPPTPSRASPSSGIAQ